MFSCRYGRSGGLQGKVLWLDVCVFTPHSEVYNAKVDKIVNDIPVVTDPASPANNFTQFGRDDAGTRFGPYDQINASNVNKLR